MEDQVLIEKILKGNDHAFRLLIEKYRTEIYHIVYSVLRHQKDAEDAAQEVFMKVYHSLPQYENQGFKTWLKRIAVNHAIDVKRKLMRRHEEVHEGFEVVANTSVEEELIRKEKMKWVQERIHELPENYRDVIYGYYIVGKSYQQLAKEQNVQVKTIETKLYRARLWMKKHWKEDDFL